VQKLDGLFEIERGINGKAAAERLATRKEHSAPLMAELHSWLRAQFAKLSRGHDLAKAVNYMLRRWEAFTRFLGDGRICLTNNAAERALCCIPLGRKAWLFCGSDRGGQRAAVLYILIQTCRLTMSTHRLGSRISSLVSRTIPPVVSTTSFRGTGRQDRS
jgi:transposase